MRRFFALSLITLALGCGSALTSERSEIVIGPRDVAGNVHVGPNPQNVQLTSYEAKIGTAETRRRLRLDAELSRCGMSTTCRTNAIAHYQADVASGTIM
jgi:hypothetical protein